MRIIDADAPISRQDVIEKINERARETFSLAPGYEHYLSALHDVANDLEQIPTIDAVPVVRCKDCIYYREGLCDRLKYSYVTNADSFCSEGERKDDADN